MHDLMILRLSTKPQLRPNTPQTLHFERVNAKPRLYNSEWQHIKHQATQPNPGPLMSWVLPLVSLNTQVAIMRHMLSHGTL
jgi:hypothetical protein